MLIQRTNDLLWIVAPPLCLVGCPLEVKITMIRLYNDVSTIRAGRDDARARQPINSTLVCRFDATKEISIRRIFEMPKVERVTDFDWFAFTSSQRQQQEKSEPFEPHGKPPPHKKLFGQIIVRHICAVGDPSNPSPSSGSRKFLAMTPSSSSGSTTGKSSKK